MCKIKIIGCGGSGTNVVNILEEKENIDIYLINSDSAALNKSKVKNKILIGNGLGCGGDIQKAKKYLEHANNEIKNILKDTDLLILTTGMGGGTGTAAVCETAKIAKEQDIPTIAVISMPFTVEGEDRISIADKGLKELNEYTNAILTIKNDNILNYIGNTASWTVNFGVVDSIVREAINSIITTITNNIGCIRIDFDDLKYFIESAKQIALKEGLASNIVEAFNSAITDNVYDSFDISKTKRMLVTLVYDKSNIINVSDIKQLDEKIQNTFQNSRSCKIQTLQKENSCRNAQQIQVILMLSC